MVPEVLDIFPQRDQKHLRLGLTPTECLGKYPQTKGLRTLEQTLRFKRADEFHTLVLWPWCGGDLQSSFDDILEPSCVHVLAEFQGGMQRDPTDLRGLAYFVREGHYTAVGWSTIIIRLRIRVDAL